MLVALAQAFMQGVAIVCGYNAVAWYETPVIDGACPDPIDSLFIVLFLPILWICWCVMLDAEFKNWPPLFLSALISWGCWYGFSRTDPPVPPEMINVIVATLIGIFSVFCHERLRLSQFSVVSIGIFLLVPGSSSVLTVANSILGAPQAFGISILLIAVEIIAGLGIATILHTLYTLLLAQTVESSFNLDRLNFQFSREATGKFNWQIHLK